MGRNRVIGVDNALPWDLPDDRAFFKATTMGKPLVKGRKTYEAIGRLLPGRRHIILTRDANYRVGGATVVHSVDEALAAARRDAVEMNADEIMVIGGGEIYKRFLPLADRIYLTEVDASPAGDAYFPELDLAEWREVSRVHHSVDARHDFAFDIVTLDRIH